eukprot:snap_masked-scaffold753_size102382-processed-gene-0.10 protein:Tk10721 transcript:snap_masked-scaffold753_size102382-processed-gene-0.10-mRNA-1 annotation:"hypothetical protein DAPPUDRAFT_188353"
MPNPLHAILRPRGPPRFRSAILGAGFSPTDLINTSRAICAQIQDLNAFTRMSDPVSVDTQARQSSLRWQKGQCRSPIDGMTVAVKDNFCLSGYPTTCGSRMLENFVPTYDATVVRKLKEAGAIVLGQTNMDEFGMGSGGTDSILGPTRNLWRSGLDYELVDSEDQALAGIDTQPPGVEPSDPDWFIAGGSSCGSAVSVAAGACWASLGSDTGGSVRIPAAWQGLVSLKPTYGSLSRHGLIPLVNSLDVPGVMARSVEDVRLVFAAIQGVDPQDSTTVIPPYNEDPPKEVSELVVGIPEEYLCEGMSAEVIEAWSHVADELEAAGARVKKVSLPHTAYAIVCYSVLNTCEVASNMARYDGLEYGLHTSQAQSTEAMYAANRSLGFNDVVRGRILSGNYFLLKANYQRYFEQALKIRRLVHRDFERTWQDGVDVLLTPVTLTTSPSFKEFSNLDNRTQTTKQDHCTQPVNLAGLPALTLPVRLSAASSLPLSVQLIGPRFNEDNLFHLATWLEQRMSFPSLKLKTPDVSPLS